jgi:hypothetical protein
MKLHLLILQLTQLSLKHWMEVLLDLRDVLQIIESVQYTRLKTKKEWKKVKVIFVLKLIK